MELDAQVTHSVSHTTRKPRGQEVDGREYFFITDEEFDDLIQKNAFLEWAHVHGHRYGTSKETIESKIREGHDLVLEIDFQGALQIKKVFPSVVLIFILPPSWQELKSRLERRGEDTLGVIELRLQNAAKEMAQASHFDFVIINQVFERALFDLKAVVHAQRLKYASQSRARAEIFQALNLN